MRARETINIGRAPRQFRSFITRTGWLAAASVIVLAVILGALMALPQRPTPVMSSIPDIEAHGTLVLDDPGALFDTGHSARLYCAGSGTFADVRIGAKVTITAGGSIVRTGKVTSSLEGDGVCELSWTVAHVPVGYHLYRIAMAGRGSVDVTEAELAASEIRLRIGPPSGQLTFAASPPPTTNGQMPLLSVTLFLIDASGPFVPMTPCTGTDRNADIGVGTTVVLGLHGLTTAASALQSSFALDAEHCAFGWFLIATAPLEQRPYTLTIAGHGSVVVQPQRSFPWLVVLILDESGELYVCDSTANPIQC